MHQSWRSRSLLYYLTVTAAILGIFGSGVYVVLRRNLYKQQDKKLITLAQSATPAFTAVRDRGSKYLNQVEEQVPWRDIFDRDRQSLEWFDEDGNLLGRRGSIEPGVSPEVGTLLIQNPETEEIFRTHTLSMFMRKDGTGSPTLAGFIRATQSNEELEAAEEKLFWSVIIGGMLTLIPIGLGSFWLTRN